ncbi:MAG: M55 family metallopeptidase [Firmicutes bacterium]|uniref:D-aminopeptidase DppA. Metallo peptidase. MEROPS family M55 n=1 Tax=Melghirimyces thermohalophilus TaxID=1236220 RepID=A0A1G6HTB4_9BACL|nr:M55 family metallopeptidase [Melghirimyces thermohalophilus]MDA8354493.1 M55 family metallopeptidase [Bacillota bacterium]SDB97388.1 D-aminopeptidase DppA. Metallo peptidase. MEROPS family M55 [Melghirimyces thermohalophilus]
MKLFISADMEGISGIHDPSHILPGTGHNYERGRSFMTRDVNTVVEAALDFGVKEVVVADSHFDGNNLLSESLHPAIRLIAGFPRPDFMMHGLDETFDAAFFVGYHTRHGAPGVLSHTISPVVRNLYLNGKKVGEFGLNSAFAGILGVPSCLVSGDDRIAEEARDWVPDIRTAIVKTAVSRTSAELFSPEKSRDVLRQQTMEALSAVGKIPPVQLSEPIEVKVEFAHSGQAEMAAMMPGTTLHPGESAVSLTLDNPRHLLSSVRALLTASGDLELF